MNNVEEANLPKILSLESGVWGENDEILSIDNERRVLNYLHKMLKSRLEKGFPTTIQVTPATFVFLFFLFIFLLFLPLPHSPFCSKMKLFCDRL